MGIFKGEPFKLPRYAFDSYVLIEVSRQLAQIDKKLGKKGESRFIFPIELGYYSCKSVSDDLNLELEFKKMNLQPYVARKKVDNRGYVVENLNVDDHFFLEPQLEDYWGNCSDELKVRNRLWSRFTLQQVITMKLLINVSGVQEEIGDYVLDPEFSEKIQGQPIPKIDWDRREEENIQARAFNVIRRT